MTMTSQPGTPVSFSAGFSRRRSERVDLPASSVVVLELIDRAREALLDACHAAGAVERHRCAQLGALRAAGALMAAQPGISRRSDRRDVWTMLSTIRPELAEWAEFFAITARRGALAAQERVTLSGREADDLLRQAEVFVELVMARLGLPMMAPLPGCVPTFQRS